MAFVIQDINSEKYLKHNGTNDDHPYDDVDSAEAAEQYKTYKHVCFVAFWYADMNRKWRVIDRESGVRYIKDKGERFKIEDEQT